MPDQTSNKGRLKPPQNIPPAGYRCLPVTIPDDNEWIAAFVGAVSKLARTSTWEFSNPTDQRDTAAIWQDVLGQMVNSLSEGLSCEADICEDGSCTEIGAFHPALSYFPNNPITTPDYEGPYATPIWGTGAGYIGATGSDAMIDVFAYGTVNLIDLLTGSALPSVTLNFNGDGEIDVQFIATVQGGAVWGYPDNNPLLGDLVSLQYTDVFSLAGVQTLIDFFEIAIQQDTEAFVVTHSWRFETAGDHTLTLIFFPTADLEPPFIGAGGGLRNVQLCGNATVIDTEVEPVDIIIDGGKLRVTVDSVPTGDGVDLDDIADLIDRWVDEVGDTMTGPLLLDGAGLANDDAIASVYGKGAQMDIVPYVGNVTLRASTGKGVSINADDVLFKLANGALLLADDGSGGTLSSRGALNINGYNRDPIHLWAKQSNRDLAQGYDYTETMRLVLRQNGELRAKALEGWDYSSTDTWRQQFKLSGDWQDDTDATRIGNVALSLDGYLGTQEIMRGMWNEAGDNPTLRFFGGDGYGFRPALINYGNTGELSGALAEVLKQYHLIEDYHVAGVPDTVPGLTAYERCSAAYYIAGFIAAIIADLFSNLYTVTYEEQVSGLIDGYGIGASFAIQLLAALEQTYTAVTDINDDLSDPGVIADMLLTADFDKAAFYALIEAYAWIEPLSVDLLEAVLDGFWPNMGDYVAIGSQTDQAACTVDFECGDIDINFRDGLSHGAVGVGVPTLGEGLHAGFDDPYYRAQVTLTFADACEFSGGSITLDTTGSNGWQVHGYTGDPGSGYTQVYQELRAATSGEETLSIGDFNGTPLDKIDIWIASQFSYYAGAIKELHLVSAG